MQPLGQKQEVRESEKSPRPARRRGEERENPLAGREGELMIVEGFSCSH